MSNNITDFPTPAAEPELPSYTVTYLDTEGNQKAFTGQGLLMFGDHYFGMGATNGDTIFAITYESFLSVIRNEDEVEVGQTIQ